MRSIGARLAFWYALAATLTSAALFLAGYRLLEGRLVHGLDLLNEAEFRQLKAHLGPDYARLDARTIDERLRDVSEYGAVLFYVSIHVPNSGVRFESRNLHGQPIPDIKGERAFTAEISGVGPVRVDEFLLPPFDVTIATPMRSVLETMQAYVAASAGLLAAGLAASVAIGLGLSRLMLRPLRLIRDTAGRIGSDNLSERIPVPDVKDEITGLARLLNATFDRLETAFDQIRRFSYEASHELKTPLSLIRLHAEKMLGDGDLTPSQADAVVVQIEELARLNQIIDELLFLSRAEAKAVGLKLTEADPAPFLEVFAQDATALAEHTGRIFAHQHRGAGAAAFDEKWIRQVLLNLVTNALNASAPGGRITLRSELGPGAWRVCVEDEGAGLPPEQHERIFERFSRLGQPASGDRGSGLGLAISRSIVRLHGGEIHAEPGPDGRGLRVVFFLPVKGGKSGLD